MKKMLPSILLLTFLISGCNSCNEDERKYEVMKRYGGWTARIDETRSTVSHIEENHHQYSQHEFHLPNFGNFSTEYAYWRKINLYMDKSGIRKASLISDTNGTRSESLYFDEHSLIYALIADREEGQPLHREYFFEENTLVLALDHQGEKRDITDSRVKAASIDLLKEAQQINEIISQKKLLP